MIDPAVFKNIAKYFTEEYYPQYINRFDTIWSILDTIDLDNIIFSAESPSVPFGTALGFGDSAEPEYAEYIRGEATICFLKKRFSKQEKIDNSELIHQYESIILSIKLSSPLQDKLKKSFIASFPPINFKSKIDTIISPQDLSSHFITDYKVIIKSNPQRGGYMSISSRVIPSRSVTVPLSKTRSAICLLMHNKLKVDWSSYLSGEPSEPIDLGWVSREDFLNSLVEWKQKTDSESGIEENILSNEISRINLLIKREINLADDDLYFIQNGKLYGRKKHYRFIIYPEFLTFERLP